MSFDTEYDEQGNQIVPLDSLLPEVLSRVAALPYTLAVRMLQTKYIEFARRTNCVRMRLDVYLQAGVGRYPLPIPAGYFLHSVRAISFGFHDGERFSAPDYWRNWGFDFRGQRYSLDDSNALRLRQTPTRDDEHPVHVYVQLVPTRDCTDIPADIAAMYGDALGAGAAGEAMNIRGKPWYDPGNSVRVMKIFYQGITDAAGNIARGRMGAGYMRTRRWI